MITIFHTHVLINNEVGADALPMSFVAVALLMGGHSGIICNCTGRSYQRSYDHQVE